MNSFSDIYKAKQLLGLGDSATLEQIRKAYYKLAKKHHPDKCSNRDKVKCEKRFKEINQAYEIVMAYCRAFEFPFRENDLKKINLRIKGEEDRKRFYDGWY